MVNATQGTEKETFDRILENIAREVVGHKFKGLPPEIHEEELREIFGKHGDVTDVPLYERFVEYLQSPEGSELFRKNIRLELIKAGHRPKGWRE